MFNWFKKEKKIPPKPKGKGLSFGGNMIPNFDRAVVPYVDRVMQRIDDGRDPKVFTMSDQIFLHSTIARLYTTGLTEDEAVDYLKNLCVKHHDLPFFAIRTTLAVPHNKEIVNVYMLAFERTDHSTNLGKASLFGDAKGDARITLLHNKKPYENNLIVSVDDFGRVETNMLVDGYKRINSEIEILSTYEYFSRYDMSKLNELFEWHKKYG